MLSYLSLLNFKANHRKTILADRGNEHVALITSANHHDGSSAHGNVALVFRGAAVADLLETEKAVVNLNSTQVNHRLGSTSTFTSSGALLSRVKASAIPSSPTVDVCIGES